jgi:hypothetical protein
MRLLPIALVTVMLGQPLGPFGGEWSADFHGTTYVRLALNDGGSGPQGGMNIGNSIRVDKQGNLESVSEAGGTLVPLLDVRRSGDVLSFSYKTTDGDIDKFELRLVDTTTAELALILSEDERKELASDGIPPPKPFRLVKSR